MPTSRCTRPRRRNRGGELYARPSRDTHSRDRLALAAELERAVDSDEIELYFQPKADLGTGRIVGVEALARWQHPVHGLLLPEVFIPLAETTGLIRALTRKVMDLALTQCAAWRAAGLDLHVSVNFAVADLLDVDLPVQVAAALERHHLPPAALIVEVTESAVFTDPVRIRDVLVRLDRLGVGLSLDDFGTGFSSLGHLKSLPVGEIKIDRSFVAAMASNAADSAIVNTTIQLAHRLGKRVVAEGVEDQETWQLLAAAGCHLVQGYALSRPLPAAQLAPLLDELAARRPVDITLYRTRPRPELSRGAARTLSSMSTRPEPRVLISLLPCTPPTSPQNGLVDTDDDRVLFNTASAQDQSACIRLTNLHCLSQHQHNLYNTNFVQRPGEVRNLDPDPRRQDRRVRFRGLTNAGATRHHQTGGRHEERGEAEEDAEEGGAEDAEGKAQREEGEAAGALGERSRAASPRRPTGRRHRARGQRASLLPSTAS